MKEDRVYYISLILVSALLCLPLICLRYIPLVDYPNHLARVHILAEYSRNPGFQQLYERLWAPIPNLGMDLLFLGLLQLLDIFAASKVFLCLCALAMVTGCHLLGREIRGGPTYAATLASFGFYNSMFLYGFVNYVLGVGLFLISLAMWLRWRKLWTAARFGAMTVLALACYVTHLTSYGFLAVSAMAFAIVEIWNKEASFLKLVKDWLPLLAPLIPLVLFLRDSGEREILWNTLPGKLLGLLALLRTYDTRWDMLRIGALAALAIVALAQGRKRSYGLNPSLILAALLLLMIMMVLPMQMLSDSGSGMDTRMAVPALLLLLFAVRLELPSAWAQGLAACAVLVLTLRLAEIWTTWNSIQPIFELQAQTLSSVEEGSTIYPIVMDAVDLDRGKYYRMLAHGASYSTVFRDTMLPTLFTQAGQMVRFRRKPAVVIPSPSNSTLLTKTWTPYDYIWILDPDHRFALAEVAAKGARIAAGPEWSLWKIDHTQ